jgi:organic hydroperoxide reductase OsmC/OhrA
LACRNVDNQRAGTWHNLSLADRSMSMKANVATHRMLVKVADDRVRGRFRIPGARLASRGAMTTILPFPHQYQVTYAEGQLLAPPRPPIQAGTPPQFGGSDQVWSPEELLVGAVLLCLKTTFEAYARRELLEFSDWQGSGTGVLEKSAGGPVFTSIQLKVQLKVAAAEQQRARSLVATAEEHCIISKAIRAPVQLQVEIVT